MVYVFSVSMVYVLGIVPSLLLSFDMYSPRHTTTTLRYVHRHLFPVSSSHQPPPLSSSSPLALVVSGSSLAAVLRNLDAPVDLKPLHAAVLRRHHFSDTFLWTQLIRRSSDSGDYCRALGLYRQMRVAGVEPDNFTFPPVLKACSRLGDLEEGERVRLEANERGFGSDIFVSNALIAMYGKGGDLVSAGRIFDEMSDRNVVTWTAMIGTLAQNDRLKEALGLFRRMLDERIRPNRATFLTVMPCVDTGEEADDLHKMIVRNCFDSDLSVQNALLGMYSRCRRIDFARSLFDGIVDKDLTSWSSMIEAYARANMFAEALDLLKQMKQLSIVLDHVAVLGIVRACSNSTLASLRHAKFIHGFVIRSLHDANLMVETALVDLYVKRGCLDSGRRLFDNMLCRNLITWSTMISGYGIHGMGHEALKLFYRMQSSMRPDHIVFVSVLSACSHAGLVNEGQRCFNSMTEEFDLVPRTEHYACMVDLLGRAGQLEEARKFIEKMPIKPDSSVWGSLLGACRIHPNLEIAELAATQLFELDTQNSGRYILLSNVYTSLGKVEEAHKIRALMKQRRVKKIAGYTVIEVRNKLYKFLVSDESNPQSSLIYKELEKLMARIREAGYIPNTNFVLHDVEEETKEKFLYMHSEKLAIVFGLMNSEPGSVIRIHKNLRVCGDCHTATKYISMVTKRKIVVRDSLRFHHFNFGVCSCGDYW